MSGVNTFPGARRFLSPSFLAPTLAVGVLVAGAMSHNPVSAPAQKVFEPGRTDICTSQTQCYGTRMRAGLMDASGHISTNSLVGQALVKIGAQGNVPEDRVQNLMHQVDGMFAFLNGDVETRKVEGMIFMRPGQIKQDPSKPFGPQNPYLEPTFTSVVFVAHDGECRSFAIKPDGSFVRVEQPFKNVSSHSISTEPCDDDTKRFRKDMAPGLGI
jgi:hypothetical protein